MRVVFLNTVYRAGSTGRIVADIAALLRANGHEALVAYGRGARVDGELHFGSWSSFAWHAITTRLLDRHGRASVAATRRMIVALRQWKPDVVHLHNVHGYYVHYPALFRFLADSGIPVIWTLHDCWALTGHCSHFDFVGCDRWKSGCGSCPQRSEYPASWGFDASRENHRLKKEFFSLPRDLTIVTPSRWLAGVVGESFFRGRRVVVIHNGVDTNVFQPTVRRFRARRGLEGKFVVLGVANVWTTRKGLSYLRDALRLLPEDCRLVIVGRVRESSELRAMHDPRVIFIPHTESASELADVYASADVFVNPTLEDTFPTTNLEALACGTPVVTFQTGGSVESVGTDTGLVVPRADLSALVSAILEVRAKGRTTYSLACVESVRSQFAKGDRYREYLSLYQERTSVAVL